MAAAETSAAPGAAARRWRLAAVAILLGGALAFVCVRHSSPVVTALRGVTDERLRVGRMLQGFQLEPYKPPPRPVFFMHGLGANVATFASMSVWVENRFPGTHTFIIKLYENRDSWTSLLTQVPDVQDYIRKTIKERPDIFKNGYDLVCHSQGAVICRTLIEDMDDHEVHTFISLAGPQMGAWGDKISLSSGVNKMLLEADLGDMIYEPLLQRSNSVANLWNDPMRHKEFIKRNEFLPVYNGLTDDKKGNQRRKKNFLRLRKAVFLVGNFGAKEFDGSIEPWQSGIWGYYKTGSKTDFVPMQETEEYMNDTFGLKTLDQQGRLFIQAPGPVPHASWVTDEITVSSYVLPYLGGQ